MQNPIQKFRQSSIVFKKPPYKTLTVCAFRHSRTSTIELLAKIVSGKKPHFRCLTGF